jgi:choline kinase
MSKADLYIIAAGKGSRMGGNVPKALVPITDEPNLTTTLKQVGSKFSTVFVVTNVNIQDQWTTYFDQLDPELSKNVVNVPIESGLGDGHAVLQALMATRDYIHHEIVIAWGDVFFPHGEIIDELLAQPQNGVGIIPAVMKDNPYVTLLSDDKLRIISADFSKYGESHPTGFHDQSVFRFHRYTLGDALWDLHHALWKNGRYITPGGELSLLFAFHYLYNRRRPATVYETNYPTLSFNTVEEVKEIQQEINDKWKSKSS